MTNRDWERLFNCAIFCLIIGMLIAIACALAFLWWALMGAYAIIPYVLCYVVGVSWVYRSKVVL